MEPSIWILYTLLLNLAFSPPFSTGTTFTFVNKCESTVWPGILANAGTATLGSTGFELPSQTSRSFQAPAGWSGRFWGRTSCSFPSPCATGDCASGTAECNGAGAIPPVTLAEFTLGNANNGLDFYDVSLVDGYNLPMLVEPLSASGDSLSCSSTGCLTDLNQACPLELKAGNGEACKSACEAFGSPEYCCSGAYGSPATCRPSIYSQLFKSACPRSYSYAYDDASSTFTCSGADYTITFCPNYPSQKSATPETPATTTSPSTSTSIPSTTPETAVGDTPVGSDFGTGSMSFEGSATTGYDSGTSGSGSEASGSGSGTETTAMLTDGSWLAGMAMGDSPKMAHLSPLLSSFIAALCLFVSSVYLVVIDGLQEL